MTNLSVQSTAVRGTTGNRLDKAGEKAKNSAACAAKVTGAAAATAGASYFPLCKINSMKYNAKDYSWNKLVNQYLTNWGQKLFDRGVKINNMANKKYLYHNDIKSNLKYDLSAVKTFFNKISGNILEIFGKSKGTSKVMSATL